MFCSAKIRISERNTKEKLVFLVISEWKCLRQSKRYEYVGEIQKENSIKQKSFSSVKSVVK